VGLDRDAKRAEKREKEQGREEKRRE